jgi:hypothetical protein
MFSAFAPTTDIAGSDRTVTMCPQAGIGHLFDQNLLPHLKFFLQKRLPQKGYPLTVANRF